MMRPACIGRAILAGVLAWTAVPAGCLAALGASPRSGVAPAPPAHPAEAAPASSAAAPGAEGQGFGGAPP
ncbi:MAG TPA: acetyl-CoA carboxylase biotin carboxyl carrier protein subunit, partial [Thermoanaerobaculia bacterium]|nr:acetyl-CoA carboxylase biotin carboxyl carrier protein subunit [Thermoanaerobaculia bacterium]